MVDKDLLRLQRRLRREAGSESDVVNSASRPERRTNDVASWIEDAIRDTHPSRGRVTLAGDIRREFVAAACMPRSINYNHRSPDRGPRWWIEVESDQLFPVATSLLDSGSRYFVAVGSRAQLSLAIGYQPLREKVNRFQNELVGVALPISHISSVEHGRAFGVGPVANIEADLSGGLVLFLYCTKNIVWVVQP